MTFDGLLHQSSASRHATHQRHSPSTTAVTYPGRRAHLRSTQRAHLRSTCATWKTSPRTGSSCSLALQRRARCCWTTFTAWRSALQRSVKSSGGRWAMPLDGLSLHAQRRPLESLKGTRLIAFDCSPNQPLIACIETSRDLDCSPNQPLIACATPSVGRSRWSSELRNDHS